MSTTVETARGFDWKQFLSGQKKQAKADEFITTLKQKSKIEVLI